MLKSKLQEVCQKKSWPLPKYSSQRDEGSPDHDPRFKATVLVNGVQYQTPHSFNTSKEAHNEAAKMALHSLLSLTTTTSAAAAAASTPPLTTTTSKTGKDVLVVGSSQTSTSNKAESSFMRDFNCQYKSYLQEYVQRKGGTPPEYSSVREGAAHAPLFKATVTVNGECYESPEFYSTIREAEQAAARVAVLSLCGEAFYEDDHLPYKNHLQELVQKKSLPLPNYKTERSGSDHVPVFKSTVEVNGEFFHGETAKTRKQAEANAAKVALGKLMLGNANQVHKKEGEATRVGDYHSPDVRKNIFLKVCNPDLSSEESGYHPKVDSPTLEDRTAMVASRLQPTKMQKKVLVFHKSGNVAVPEGSKFLPWDDDNWFAVELPGSDR